MKTVSKIILAVLIVLLVAVLVIGVLEMPVAEEGQELTKAQKVVVLLKTHLNAILSGLNLSLGAVLTLLFRSILTQSGATAKNAASTDGKVAELSATLDKITDGLSAVDALSKKTDILMQELTDTLMLSDLPVSVREKITHYSESYAEISGKATAVLHADVVDKAVATVSDVLGNVANEPSVAPATEPVVEPVDVVERF